MSFADYKSRRGSNTAEKLAEAVNALDPQSRKRTEDTRFWKPGVDKAGNGYAVIRFLPSLDEDDLVVPFVTVYDHGFQGPSGKWYIENSLTTLGENDPVSEYNTKLWNSGSEADKKKASKQKRRVKYITNIYVVKDPSNPANEGKVFLYRLGTKLYGKIKDAMTANPAFPDEKQIVPYDFWEGANFKLKVRQVDDFPNYDTSTFDEPSPLSNDEKELERIYNSLHPLKRFVDPNGKDHNGYPLFKSYDELKEKLFKVLEISDEASKASAPRTERVAPVKEEDEDLPWVESPKEDEDSSGGDDTLDYFRKLAEEE